MSTNLNTTLYERPHYVATEQSNPPPFFRPLLAALPGSPPNYPGWGAGACTLNSFERAEVDRYLLNPTDAALATLRLPDAIALAKLFKTYLATAAYLAWRDAAYADTRSQWKQFMADATVNTKGTTSKSADAAGVGASPPPSAQTPSTDV